LKEEKEMKKARAFLIFVLTVAYITTNLKASWDMKFGQEISPRYS